MAILTITAESRITLGDEILAHLGVPPGGKISVNLLPYGRAELKAARDWSDLAGLLDGKTNGTRLTIEDMNEAGGEGGADAGKTELD